MEAFARPVPIHDTLPWRDQYRQEMNCQIIHDSLHRRPAWTYSHALFLGEAMVGYGAVAVGGPWKDLHSIFEFYVAPHARHRIFDLFAALLASTGVRRIETQSNDHLLTTMLLTFATDIVTESILFQDHETTHHSVDGAVFQRAESGPVDENTPPPSGAEGTWVVKLGDTVAASGGILFHYNRPYGDVHMEVAKPFRGRGLGAFIVQELKRVCREHGHTPGARCNTSNLASRRTLQKAGFVPCGHIVIGTVQTQA